MKSYLSSHPVIAAVMLMFICLLPVMILRDFSPSNELRYLSIADEAISQGHVFVFTNQGEPYADKPPLYFWLMMLSRLVFGSHCMFVLSLFSFIPAAVIMAVMDRWLMMVARNNPGVHLSGRDRFAAALILGTSAMFLGMSVFLRMDLLMCMFIVLALYTFYKMYRGTGNMKKDSIMLPVYIFLALFSKGPVGLLVPPLAIVVFLFFERKIKDVGKYLGLKTWGIMIVLCVLWFTGVWIEGGRPYLENLLFHQTVDRAVDAFHHKQPFWYYLTVIWYVAAPYSIALVPVLVATFFRGGANTDAGRLFVAVSVSTFLMLSAFSSKLAVYLLPIFPFLAYLFPLEVRWYTRKTWVCIALAIPAAILAIAGAAGIVYLALHGSIRLFHIPDSFAFIVSPLTYLSLGIMLAGGVVSIYSAYRTRSWQMPVISLSVSMLLCILPVSFLLPEANSFIGYRNLCNTALEMKAESHGQDMQYVTLDVSRSENMDTFLQSDVRRFEDDADGYTASMEKLGPHILMVRTSCVEDHPDLESALTGYRSETVGDYTVFCVEGR